MLNANYLNGEVAFCDYLSAKIKYPKKAKMNGVIGLSVFSFSVDCENTPENFIFTTKLGSKIEEEIKKAILSTKGNWKECGKGNSGSRINLKIAFSINFLYSPDEVDCVIDEVSRFKVLEDAALQKKMEVALKGKDFKKAKNALELLLKRYPFNEGYQNKMLEIKSNL
jgi:hypothetical protein